MRLVLGIVELVGCVLVAASLLLALPGTAMCTDAGSAQYCRAVDSAYLQVFGLTVGTGVAAVITLVLHGRRGNGAAAVAVVGATLLVALVVRAGFFYHLALQPIH